MAGVRTVRHKSLTRIDHPAKHTFGYIVRIRWKGELHSKFFSDRKHGDRLGALAAALEWRDATERSLGKPRTDQPVVSNPRPGASGIHGVRRLQNGDKAYYEATWIVTPGKVGRTRYSVAKHGEVKACRLAQRARKLNEERRWKIPRESRVVEAPQPMAAIVAPRSQDDQKWHDLLAAVEVGGASQVRNEEGRMKH